LSDLGRLNVTRRMVGDGKETIACVTAGGAVPKLGLNISVRLGRLEAVEKTKIGQGVLERK